MIEHRMNLREHVEKTMRIVADARPRGIFVEAELGVLSGVGRPDCG
jgi:fructose/tagatose bisphosphate aldolase